MSLTSGPPAAFGAALRPANAPGEDRNKVEELGADLLDALNPPADLSSEFNHVALAAARVGAHVVGLRGSEIGVSASSG